MHPRTRFMTPVEACRPHKANVKNYNTVLRSKNMASRASSSLSAPAATLFPAYLFLRQRLDAATGVHVVPDLEKGPEVSELRD